MMPRQKKDVVNKTEVQETSSSRLNSSRFIVARDAMGTGLTRLDTQKKIMQDVIRASEGILGKDNFGQSVLDEIKAMDDAIANFRVSSEVDRVDDFVNVIRNNRLSRKESINKMRQKMPETFKNRQISDIEMLDCIQYVKKFPDSRRDIAYIAKNFLCKNINSQDNRQITASGRTVDELSELTAVLIETHKRKRTVLQGSPGVERKFSEKKLTDAELVKCLRLMRGNGDSFEVFPDRLFDYWDDNINPTIED